MVQSTDLGVKMQYLADEQYLSLAAASAAIKAIGFRCKAYLCPRYEQNQPPPAYSDTWIAFGYRAFFH
jgi:hypothetical protein